MSQFFTYLDTLLSVAATTPHEFLITGDFNLHVDDLHNSNTKQFLITLTAANLSQHVHFPTHTHQHTLDLIITHSNSTLSPNVNCSAISPSDHYPLFTSITIQPPISPPPSVQSFCSIKSINVSRTLHSLDSSLIT